jgi:DNA-binding beta-propeller fold protein YncE
MEVSMSVSGHSNWKVWAPTLAVVALLAVGRAYTQEAPHSPANDLGNFYQPIENYFKMPAGRKMGSVAGLHVDPDGRSLWAAERCGANSCVGSNLDPVLKFDASGKLVRSFGAGMILFPHGLFVDPEGNVWVTDSKGPDGKDPKTNGKGHCVIKFSPEGKMLLTLGKPGVAGNPPEALTEPQDVLTAANGDIFVAEGADGEKPDASADTVNRISKFTKDGKFIKSWGKFGSERGEFKTPHRLAFDTQGRLFVLDRGNKRIQIFDQNGTFLEQWNQFGRESGICIDRNDTLFLAHSESAFDSTTSGWTLGIVIGSARDGKVMQFVPDPEVLLGGKSLAEAVAVDAVGNIYSGESGPRGLRAYMKR